MRILFSLAIAALLSWIAWPGIDAADEPARPIVAAGQFDWPASRAAWVGDDDKRNAIIMSAVWVPGKEMRP